MKNFKIEDMIVAGSFFYDCKGNTRELQYYYAYMVNGKDIILKPLKNLPDNEQGKKEWFIHYIPSLSDRYNFIFEKE